MGDALALARAEPSPVASPEAGVAEDLGDAASFLLGKRMVEGSDEWQAAKRDAETKTSKALADAGKKGGDTAGRGRPKASASQEAKAYRDVDCDPAALLDQEDVEAFHRLSRERASKARDHAAESAQKQAARLAAEVGVSRPTMERALELARRLVARIAAVLRRPADPRWICDHCGARVADGRRELHLVAGHGLPPGLELEAHYDDPRNGGAP